MAWRCPPFLLLLSLGLGCAHAAPPAGDDESRFGPLDIGSDYASYHKVSRAPFLSKTHGGRFVEVYVNDAGYEAYTHGNEPPVGTVLVKTSWESAAGQPSAVAGPIFVMRREPAGTAPDQGDWSYAIHWADPTPEQRRQLGGPIYWRGKSPRVSYCWKCHDNYEHEIGGVPSGLRAWETP